MDVAWNYKRNTLYIADTFNHKIKYVTGLSENHKKNYYNNTKGNVPGAIIATMTGSVNTLPLPVKVCNVTHTI